jgi:hypothetical protein
VQSALENHRLKQGAGIVNLPITVREDRIFLAAMMAEADPTNEDCRAELEELDTLADRIAKRLPDDRMGLRERAFYVDPSEGGWRRPVALSGGDVSDRMMAANLDYALFRGLVSNSQEFAWLRELLETWPERPELPAPPWAPIGLT